MHVTDGWGHQWAAAVTQEVHLYFLSDSVYCVYCIYCIYYINCIYCIYCICYMYCIYCICCIYCIYCMYCIYHMYCIYCIYCIYRIYCVCAVKKFNSNSRRWRKKVPKFIENLPKIDVWGCLGTFLEPLDKHLGHMLPKDWILEVFGSVLGAQDGQFGSNLEAQDLSKSMQEREKVDIKKGCVFGIDF